METAENLCLDFGCQGEKEFCKGLKLFVAWINQFYQRPFET